MYTVSEFAKKVGVTVHTVQRWDRDGKLTARRTHTNRRYYTDEDVAHVLVSVLPPPTRRTVAYCRVSRQSQKADLVNQRQLVEQFCVARGLIVDEWIEEVGGGLNLKRRKFLKLIEAIIDQDIKILVIAHKDRLARFGYDLIAHLCEKYACELLVMNSESLSPQEEMVQDLMTIIHTFSSRLYGLKNYKKALQKALEDDTNP